MRFISRLRTAFRTRLPITRVYAGISLDDSEPNAFRSCRSVRHEQDRRHNPCSIARASHCSETNVQRTASARHDDNRFVIAQRLNSPQMDFSRTEPPSAYSANLNRHDARVRWVSDVYPLRM